MNIPKSFILGLLLGGVVTYCVTLYTIHRNQEYDPIKEAKICLINLEGDDPKHLSPQLREYLKARLYSNASDHINKGWFAGRKLDYGPVNLDILGNVYAIKNASDPNDLYESAMERHHPGTRKK